MHQGGQQAAVAYVEKSMLVATVAEVLCSWHYLDTMQEGYGRRVEFELLEERRPGAGRLFGARTVPFSSMPAGAAGKLALPV